MYTKEQTDRANATSIIALLEGMGYADDIERVGRDEYKLRGFGGFQINDSTGQFNCFSDPDLHGVGAVNFLMKFANVRFLDAMEKLGEYREVTYYRPQTRLYQTERDNVSKSFREPQHADNNKRVYAYLCKTRGISSDVVHRMIHEGLLYQDIKGNAVFLNIDGGKAIGAHICGTMTDVRYKQNIGAGCFQFDGNSTPEHAYVFESNIDMMSFMTIHLDKISSAKFISMSGLKPNFIEKIAKQYTNMKFCFCVDNDEAGKNFVDGMEERFGERQIFRSHELESTGAKDYNDLLRLLRESEARCENSSFSQQSR
jgi:hypothetical protein